MFDYGFFKFESKAELLDKAIEYWNPGKTKFWQDAGIDLVIDRREGYFLYDMSGRRLIDLHLNGGTYNFGHRHPELVATLKSALDYFDMGNHWFPSVARAAFAEKLVGTAPGMKYAIFGAGGAEAVEIALKTARYATKRRKIVSIVKGYHGHSGLSVATGDDRFSKIFLADRPDEFFQVPFNNVDALERALRGRDVAAFIIETIPATYGFPLPDEGYLRACQDLCRRYGTLYIADEVQTGLLRTGVMWGWQSYGLQPDMFVTGRGLGGGIYPISACVVTEECGGWLHEDGAAHSAQNFAFSPIGAPHPPQTTAISGMLRRRRDMSPGVRGRRGTEGHQNHSIVPIAVSRFPPSDKGRPFRYRHSTALACERSCGPLLHRLVLAS